MRKILIVGATSAIAEATARLFAAEGDQLFLVARDVERLQSVADDLMVRGAGRVATATLDVCRYDRHGAVIDEAAAALGGLDTVLIAHGTLPDQKACEVAFELTREALEVNAVSVISLLTQVANRFEKHQAGTIVVISSVAGDRGRQSNYVYGAAKGCLNVFLQGIAHRLSRSGIRVLTVKPGFVDTPMTTGIEKNALWATPEQVARDIHRAIGGRRQVLYTPWFWRWIMRVVCNLPTRLFHRTRL